MAQPKDPLEPIQFPVAPGSSETVEAPPSAKPKAVTPKKKPATKKPPQQKPAT